MRKNMRCLLAVMASATLLVLVVCGCSDRNKERPASEPRAASRQAAGEATTENGSDLGKACKFHAYYIAPGESASVTFEDLVDADMAKTARENEPTVQKESLEAAGYSVSYSGRSVDTFSASVPVWVVSEPDFAVKENERVLYAALDGKAIDWDRNGEGTIRSVPGAVGKFAVGKLPLEKVVGKKGSIDIRGPNKKIYSLTPFQKTVTEEFHLLSVTLDITAPEKHGKPQTRTDGSVLWNGKGIGFSKIWDFENNRYLISGKANSRECLE